VPELASEVQTRAVLPGEMPDSPHQSASEADLGAMSAPALRRRAIGNTLAQLITPIFRTGAGIALTAALSRHLGLTGFGEYALVFAYVATFVGIFANSGLNVICLREVSSHPERRSEVLASILLLQALIALATYVLIIGSLPFLRYPAQVNAAVALYGLTVFFTPLDILALPFSADLRQHRLLLPGLVSTALHFGLSGLVVVLGGSMLALVAAAFAALVVQYVWITWLSITAVPLRFASVTRYWRPFIAESWPLGLATVITTLLQQAPILALSFMTLDEVALFNAASRIPQQLLIIPTAVGATVFPLLTRTWESERSQFSHLLGRVIGSSILVAVPVVVMLTALTEPITLLLYGDQFAGAAAPFALMLGVSGVLCIGLPLGNALLAAGLQRISLLIVSGALPFLLGALFLLVPRTGASGAAAALLLSQAVVVVASLIFMWRRVAVADAAKSVIWAIGSGAAGLAVAHSLQHVHYVVAGLAGGGVSLIALSLMRPEAVREWWSIAHSLLRRRGQPGGG
jgi:O-antigen/teichoic acid export membrane protein